MKLNKKFAGFALITLLAPTLLTAQQAFAETNSTEETTAATAATDNTTTADSSTDIPVVEEISSTEPSTVEPTVTSESAPEVTVPSESTEITSEVTTGTTSEATTETTAESKEEKVTKAAASVTFNFFMDGEMIPSKTITGSEGDVVSTKVPAGYGISGISSTDFFGQNSGSDIYITGALTVATTSVDVTLFKLNTGADVTITLVDTNGDLVIGGAISSLGGNIGEAFEYTAPEVYGYKLVSAPVVTGTFTAEAQNIEVVYERMTSTITIVCLDIFGNNIIDNQVFEDYIGEAGILEPAVFPGMELISVNGAPVSYPIDVEFTDQNQVITLVYGELVPAQPTPDPIVPVPNQITPSPAAPVTPAPVPVNNTPAPLVAKKKGNLPQTGEESNGVALTMLGMTFVASVYFTKKRKEDEFTL